MSEGPMHAGSPALRVVARLGGVVLAAVVIFGLGVMVGKRVAESVPAVSLAPTALPTETMQPQPAVPSAPARALRPDKLTFYDRLSGVAPPPPVELPAAPPPLQPASAALAVRPSSPAQPPPTAARDAPARPADAKVAARQTAPRPTDATTIPEAGASPTKAPTPGAATAASAAAPSKADAETQIRKLSGNGRFAVQVASVTDRAAADQTTARLKQHGFGVETVMAVVKGKVWYRIRVGPFPGRDAATKAAGIFHAAYGLNAIAVQD